MTKKKGFPEVGEFVICRISRINPHSAFAALEEYDTEGMIHISEVSTGWVKDIRKFVRLNELRVAKVVRIDDQGRISLSLKRVNRQEESRKMRSYRMEHRAEKMLELAAQTLKKSLEEAYEEIGFKLQEFGSLYDAFLMAMQKPDSLAKKGIPEKWVSALKEIAEKNIEQKEFEFKAKLAIKTFKPSGIYIIKNILTEAEKMNLDVRYIAAPNYLVKYRSKNAKRGEREFLEKLNRLAESKEAEVNFVIA